MKLVNVQFSKGSLNSEKRFGVDGFTSTQFLICAVLYILLKEVRIVNQFLCPSIHNILYGAIGATIFNGQAFLGHVLIECIQLGVYMELSWMR